MSWKENLENIQFKIVTGEGSEFTPLWKNASRSLGFNLTPFEFNEVEGTLVRRGKASSFVFPIELHFTGEDHIDDADSFMEAAKDQRPWTITHPNYGDILVHPSALKQDDSRQNDSIITGDLFETIPDTFPNTSIDVQADVSAKVDNAATNLSNDFGNIGTVDADVVSDIETNLNTMGDKFKLAAVTDLDFENVNNRLNNALAALDNISNDAISFMNRTAELVRSPAKFYASVESRINTLEESYDDLKQAIEGTQNLQNKKYFESVAGLFTTGKAEATVFTAQDVADEQGIEDNEITDYNTRSQVLDVIESINDALNDYTETLGDLQSEVDATPDSFTPLQDGVNATKEAINASTGQLLQIAVGSRQERVYVLPKDTNIINLIHRLTGKTDNETIIDFTNANDILLDEVIQVPKGREVTYYI